MSSIPHDPPGSSEPPRSHILSNPEVVELLDEVERLGRLASAQMTLIGSLDETAPTILRRLPNRPGPIGFALVELPDGLGAAASRTGYGPTGTVTVMVSRSLPLNARIVAALSAAMQIVADDADDETAGLDADPATHDETRTTVYVRSVVDPFVDEGTEGDQ